MRVAVTGATGFVGRQLVGLLREAGADVRALVRDPKRADLDGVELSRWEAGHTDVASLEGADAVCHLAAFLPPDYRDPAHARRCLEVNALGTLELLEATRDAGVSSFVNVSSGNVYGPLDRPAREDDPVWPARQATWYLSSKLTGELYVAHADHAGWLRGVTLRPSAVYGPGMKGGVVPLFAGRLCAGEPVTVQDGGRHRVDLVHVRDVARAVVAAARTSVHGTYNVGSGRTMSMLELARTLASAVDVPADLIVVEPAGEGPPTGFPALDITRARQDLGYVTTDPHVGLGEFARSLVTS